MLNSVTLLFDMNKRPPIKSIVEALSSGLDNDHAVVSTNPDDHDYCPEFTAGSGVAVSYKNLSEHDNIFLNRLLFKIAVKYGKKETNLKDNKLYPFIYYDEDEKVFMIEEHRWDSMDTDEYVAKYDNDLGKLRILSENELDTLDDEEERGNGDVWDDCYFYDFLCITETTVYEEDEPSFFISKFFWNRRKKIYEREAKRALRNVDYIGLKNGVI